MSRKTKPNKAQRRKAKRVVKVLKVKHPVEVPLDTLPPELPEPVRALVEAIAAKEVVAIHLVNPCPTRWQRLKRWLGVQCDE